MEQKWWTDPLAAEIHRNFRQQEENLPVYLARSPQLSSRRYLVDWLAVICDKFGVCVTARHLAISLLDRFMDRFDIDTQQLQLVALGCLLVAAKFEEQEVKVPKAAELSQFLPPPGFPLLLFLQMELTVLETFDWNVCLPTAAHFADYFLAAAVTAGDYSGALPLLDCDRVLVYMNKYLNYFLEISLQDYTYRDYKPSQVCAACIASSRICIKITPQWSGALQKVTRYSWHELQSLVDMMLKTHETDRQAVQNQQCLVPAIYTLSPSNMSTGSPMALTPPTPATPASCQGDGLLKTGMGPVTLYFG